MLISLIRMQTLDVDVFVEKVCPCLSGRLIEMMFLMNKQYSIVKNTRWCREYIFHLFWEKKQELFLNGFLSLSYFLKDNMLEGECIRWDKKGNMIYRHYYRNGHQDGEQFNWYGDYRKLTVENYTRGIRQVILSI
jgi:antitoxin component YwqK of YwqJK toxin-antitoxin module